MNDSLANITAPAVERMSYNELIGLVRETNRIPGGASTVHAIVERCRLSESSRVLDIGTSTGSTAIELAALARCSVSAIDVNEQSLIEARRRADALGVVVDFRVADATALPFAEGSFDTVICGNVTSLIVEASRALSEYDRVLAWGGYLIAVPMYYRVEPPEHVVERVRQAIQVPIKVTYRDEALDFYLNDNLELLDTVDFAFDDIAESKVTDFCDVMLAQDHLADMDSAALAALSKAYRQQMQLFRDNLAMMGFTIMVFRKSRLRVDPELFSASLVSRRK